LEAQRAIEAANVYKEVEDRSHLMPFKITHQGLNQILMFLVSN
jgi:hypothetical protein